MIQSTEIQNAGKVFSEYIKYISSFASKILHKITKNFRSHKLITTVGSYLIFLVNKVHPKFSKFFLGY